MAAELVTIARPYAEASFRIAVEDHALNAWSERLSLLATIADDAAMRPCLSHPRLSAMQKSELFKAIVASSLGGAVDAAEARLIDLLAKNERLAVLPEIARLYEGLKDASEGVTEATIYSAFPLDEEQLSTLLSELQVRFKTQLNAQVCVDQSLIGGVKIVVGDQVLDSSVRGKLESMGVALKN
ncbi:MAG: F0F1 ATP synthase subunit delta [Pseudomonadota bacterium]